MSLILSSDIQDALLPVKIIFLIFDIFFLGFFIFFLVKTRWFKLFIWYDLIEFFTQKIYGGVRATKRWHKIKGRMLNIREEEFNLVVVELHDILGKILERMAPFHQTKTFSERLAKVGEGTFPGIKDIWEAYEIYRLIKKDPNYRVSREDFSKILNTYEQVFKDLELA